MSESQNNIFDATYVGKSQVTVGDEQKKSGIKQFLKNPIAVEDVKQYGTSKPSRTVIRASLQNGKS
ncbi:MAG: hypothetical protein QM527_12880 [Alphaproteobacteria bacterium]|nr:hypothetical protein [Alphaproteobacteria bacterium]